MPKEGIKKKSKNNFEFLLVRKDSWNIFCQLEFFYRHVVTLHLFSLIYLLLF